MNPFIRGRKRFESYFSEFFLSEPLQKFFSNKLVFFIYNILKLYSIYDIFKLKEQLHAEHKNIFSAKFQGNFAVL